MDNKHIFSNDGDFFMMTASVLCKDQGIYISKHGR